MLKKNELSHPTSCLNKAGSNEPIFVLRAHDPLAAMTIRHWAAMSEDCQEGPKLDDALSIADEMDDWYKQNRQQPVPPPAPAPAAAEDDMPF